MTAAPTPRQLIEAIDAGDDAAIERLLAAAPGLATAAVDEGASRAAARAHFLPRLGYVYAGDTALHFAAAAYRADLAKRLIALGADVGAQNRRGATALHAAASGNPDGPGWNPAAQAQMIAALVAAGADPNAPDRNGAAPLHKAIRTRCAAAVEALLKAGADARRATGNGTAALKLAQMSTGRGGSGSPAAKAQQAAIIALLEGTAAAV